MSFEIQRVAAKGKLHEHNVRSAIRINQPIVSLIAIVADDVKNKVAGAIDAVQDTSIASHDRTFTVEPGHKERREQISDRATFKDAVDMRRRNRTKIKGHPVEVLPHQVH